MDLQQVLVVGLAEELFYMPTQAEVVVVQV